MPERDSHLPNLLRDPQFIVSAHNPSQWPPDQGAEAVFAGRSNVGKSSAINAILQRRALARTSKTPGRTQQIVFFSLAPQRHLVDLPGYGYAKVSIAMRKHWENVIQRYLTRRQSLRGVMLVMDARHPLTALDEQMLEWCARAVDRPVHILLTKADKLTRAQGDRSLTEVRRAVAIYPGASAQLFSATTGAGQAQARDTLVAWLQGGEVGAGGETARAGK